MQKELIAHKLKNIRWIREHISVLEQRRTELEFSMKRISQSALSEVKSNDPTKNRTLDLLIKLEELDCLIAEKIIEYNQVVLEVEEKFEHLSFAEKDILTKYYIQGMKWKDVSKITFYSTVQCWRIQNAAIEKLVALELLE